MKNYLFIVEGAHDIAAIKRVLKLLNIKNEILHKNQLNDIWQSLIPTGYPFEDDNLSRFSPIPTFFSNGDISVAVKNANSDSKLFVTLDDIISSLRTDELGKLAGIAIFCDADSNLAKDKIEKLLYNAQKNDEFGYIVDLNKEEIMIRNKKIKFYTYAFPDNTNDGVLEDLLLEAAEEEYADLLKEAKIYVDKVDAKYKDEWSISSEKKTLVGCISNILKPGKPNQASIADKNWISSNSIVKCNSANKMYDFIKRIIQL